MKLQLATLSLVALSIASANQISESQQRWVKHYEKQKTMVPPAEALVNDTPEPVIDESFQTLYNGVDLEGWTPRGGHCTFEASGESILGTCVPGSASTYLSTDREDYDNFIFTAELYWEVDGNTGIMFRAQRRTGKNGREIVYGPQCEMEGFSKNRGWSGGIYGQSVGGWFYPLWLDAHEEARKALKKGEWNRVTIQATGKHVKTWINGVPTAHWIDEEYGSGYIGLQVHSGKKGTIRFRNIKIKEVEDDYENLFSENDFSKWTNMRGNPVVGWTIEDGVISRPALKQGERRPGSIITKAVYENFDLKFEWNVSEGGNSGIKYRSKGDLGLEYQILDDGVHRDHNLTAGIYALVAASEDKPYFPAGQWNTGRVIVEGNHVEHWINGAKVATIEIGSEDWDERFNKSKYKKHGDAFGRWVGPIYLQDHNDPVSFRNIRIRRL